MNCEERGNAVLDCEPSRGWLIGPLDSNIISGLSVDVFFQGVNSNFTRAIWEAINPAEPWISDIHYREHLERRPKPWVIAPETQLHEFRLCWLRKGAGETRAFPCCLCSELCRNIGVKQVACQIWCCSCLLGLFLTHSCVIWLFDITYYMCYNLLFLPYSFPMGLQPCTANTLKAS